MGCGIYLQCEICRAVFDKRPNDDPREGGTFRTGQQSALYDAAEQAGWTIVQGHHLFDERIAPDFLIGGHPRTTSDCVKRCRSTPPWV